MGESSEVEISHLSPDLSTLGFRMISVGKNKLLEFVSSSITYSSNPSETSRENRLNKKDKKKIINRSVHFENKSYKLPELTLKDVSYHDTPLDCWVIIYDNIYDISSFIQEHPGGEEVLLEYAGRDATLPFKGVGHSILAEASLKPYLVGVLIQEDRIWSRFPNGNENK